MFSLRLLTGIPGPSGFGSASTAEEVTEGIDASDLTIIITGGGCGLGLETTRVLALRNAHVIIGARNMEDANRAKHLILKENKNGRVDVLKLDLASLKSVKAFADNFIALNLPLNILINNAGIMNCPYQLSEDGIEFQFATNHLGHFYLTNLLLDKMIETEKLSGIEGRIVNLSSVAHILYPVKGGIRFDEINDPKSYNEQKAYGQSKLANILHANELSRRFKEQGLNLTANSVHPGLIMTKLFQHSAWRTKVTRFFSFIIWKNISQGAATTCYVALHPRLKGISGEYFADCNRTSPSNTARDHVLGKKLWEFSNMLIDAANVSKASHAQGS